MQTKLKSIEHHLKESWHQLNINWTYSKLKSVENQLKVSWNQLKIKERKLNIKLILLKASWNQLKVYNLKSIESKLKSIESNLKSNEHQLKSTEINWSNFIQHLVLKKIHPKVYPKIDFGALH